MDYDHFLRDGTNNPLRGAKPLFAPNKALAENNSVKVNKENVKPNKNITKIEIKRLCKEDSIMDISMLSISGSESSIPYKLPESSELSNELFKRQWVSEMSSRRWNNRISVCGELDRLEKKLNDISFDLVTGERYLVETLDYRMDLEVSKLPLGRNFLLNSKVDPCARQSMINILFNISECLKTDRYIVPMAVACIDRYTKIKGDAMIIKNYRDLAISCWFLCCKFELVYYPSIDDLCELTKIADPDTLINFEADILKTLDFYISMPTPIEYLRPLTLLKQREGVSHNIAKFFIEASLYVYDLACHPAHIIAAASYCLSLALSFRLESLDQTWTGLMKIFTGIDIEDIRPLIAILVKSVMYTNYDQDFPVIAREHSTVIEVLSKRHVDMQRLSKL